MDLKDIAKTAAENGGDLPADAVPQETTPTPEPQAKPSAKKEPPSMSLQEGASILMSAGENPDAVPDENADTNYEPADSDSEDPDAPVINIGAPKAKPKPDANPADDPVKATPEPTPVPVAIGVEGINLDAVSVTYSEEITARDKLIKAFNASRPDEIKKLILSGFSPDEAEAALDARLKKQLEKLEHKDETPEKSAEPSTEEVKAEETAQIIIDKSKGQTPNDLGLTADEHSKLARAKVVKLISVEDAELANIEVEAVDAKHKADYIHSIEGTLSQYSVPLPLLGDFIPFKGAQIIQLASAIEHGDERVEESINRKASLIYEKMMNGQVLKKFNEKGKIILSYDEFLNRFPYQDLDMGIYGILCASTMEQSTASITCNNCDHTWDQEYNVKTLLQMDGLTDAIKQRFDDVLGNRSNPEILADLNSATRKARRFKSPFTGNVYDMNAPSVGRAINILKKIKQDDQVMVYNSAIALYLTRVLIYNRGTGKYLEVTENESDLMLDTTLTLPDADLKLLINQIQENMSYQPGFAIKCTCPSCEKQHTLPVSVDNLVFLLAQDSLTEIQ